MTGLPSVNAVQYWSGIAAIVGVPFAIFAVIYAARQLSLARRAGSAASLITLTDSFRENWELYLKAEGDAQGFAFANLANMLEAACATHRDKVFYGHSKTVLEFYLVAIFRILQDNEGLQRHLLNLLQTKETFENIRHFFTTHKTTIDSSAWKVD